MTDNELKEKLPQLTPGQYWEWRTTIEEMQHSSLKLKHSRLTHSLMERDIEIQKLKAIIYKNRIKEFEAQYDLSKKEYERFKESLEKDLGVSLSNKVIDDITFEVKELDVKD